MVVTAICSFLPSFWGRAIFDFVILGSTYITAFVLLVLAYLVEVRTRKVGIPAWQKYSIVAAFVLPVVYAVYLWMSWPFHVYLDYTPLIQYILFFLSIGLVLIVLTIMFSFHRAKVENYQIHGMIGFLLIICGWATIGAFFGLGELDSFQKLTDGWSDPILAIAGLLGYVVFLASFIQTRPDKIEENRPVAPLTDLPP